MPKLENHSGFDRDNRSLSAEGVDYSPESWLTPELQDAKHIPVEERELMQAAIWDAQIGLAIEVETTAIDDRPYGLDDFPLVLTIWEYLHGKDARSMKQIRDAMRKTGRISEDNLRAKLPAIEGYNEALKTVIQFGVGRGFLKEVSEDTYEAIKTL